ncbi:DUF6153 family protein [Saccharomonospora glauca]|uniref:Uncharacterized protein n=1 Tax=Saccharomonospora glauca K62 TaxID=928724 RepID=I1CY16_9PSEU|nr:DUF6153 family protein [Saccharomonospora glauca]EIE97590.1 hypothetical protein SacglDRAFT_00644 [Saccharomonospora glauca K62]
MTDGRRSVIPRWLLLCLVLLGLVTMHHVVDQHSEHTGSATALQQVAVEHHGPVPDDSPAPSHDHSSVLGHLCFAVLVGSIVLLLAVRFVRRFPGTVARLRPRAAHTGGGRAPPVPLPLTSGFAYDLCVLRL